eukprot:6474950-Amphidinium_carterae.1
MHGTTRHRRSAQSPTAPVYKADARQRRRATLNMSPQVPPFASLLLTCIPSFKDCLACAVHMCRKEKHAKAKYAKATPIVWVVNPTWLRGCRWNHTSYKKPWSRHGGVMQADSHTTLPQTP